MTPYNQQVKKDIRKCKRSNNMNGNFGRITTEHNLCISYKPLQNIGNRGLKFNMTLKPSSLKPPDQKVYITHHKAMTILDLVEISVRLNMITRKSKV